MPSAFAHFRCSISSKLDLLDFESGSVICMPLGICSIGTMSSMFDTRGKLKIFPDLPLAGSYSIN